MPVTRSEKYRYNVDSQWQIVIRTENSTLTYTKPKNDIGCDLRFEHDKHLYGDIGGVVSVVTSGTCTIRANQAGGLSGGITYAEALAISQSFTVRTAQTIVFADPSPLD